MKKKIESIKNSYNISNIFPISPITLQKEKVLLFFSEENGVAYSLYTDGNVEHLDTWVDKKPYERDEFLEGCAPVKRFEFQVTSANILLIEKRYRDSLVRNLYVDENKLYKVINNSLYQVSINPKEKLMIKRMEGNNGN